jgi:hypothetical protein
MSEFKFSCPNCGQHIAADEGWSGASIQCPKCASPIVVPRLAVAAPVAAPPAPMAPAAAAPPRVVLASPPQPPAPHVHLKAASPAPPAPPVPPKTAGSAPPFSALAIVSLVLALVILPLNAIAFLVGFPAGLLGGIPAVVCGHLALGRSARSRGLRGAALAKWGLGLGYSFMVLGLVSWGVLALGKLAGPGPQADRGARPGDVSAQGTPAAPAAPETAQASAGAPAPQTADAPVATNPDKVEIPAHAASGTLYGQPFTVDKAKVTAGILELTQGKGALPDAEIKIFLFLKPTERLDGQSFVVSPQSTHGNPHVHLAQRQAGGSRGILSSKYALRLEFDKPTGKRIPFKLYFEAPKSYDTTVTGNGIATIQ